MSSHRISAGISLFFFCPPRISFPGRAPLPPALVVRRQTYFRVGEVSSLRWDLRTPVIFLSIPRIRRAVPPLETVLVIADKNPLVTYLKVLDARSFFPSHSPSLGVLSFLPPGSFPPNSPEAFFVLIRSISWENLNKNGGPPCLSVLAFRIPGANWSPRFSPVRTFSPLFFRRGPRQIFALSDGFSTGV